MCWRSSEKKQEKNCDFGLWRGVGIWLLFFCFNEICWYMLDISALPMYMVGLSAICMGELSGKNDLFLGHFST